MKFICVWIWYVYVWYFSLENEYFIGIKNSYFRIVGVLFCIIIKSRYVKWLIGRVWGVIKMVKVWWYFLFVLWFYFYSWSVGYEFGIVWIGVIYDSLNN